MADTLRERIEAMEGFYGGELISRATVLALLAERGATGTAQTTTPAATAGTQVGEEEVSAAYMQWLVKQGMDGNWNIRTGFRGGYRTAREGSPQPAEPRAVALAELDAMTAESDRIVRGGDTLTPETPLETAQPDVFENAPTSDLVKGLRWIDDRYSHMSDPTSRFAAAGANRLEAQAARIAALESTLRLFAEHRWIPESFQDTARRALVGEEAPA